MDSIKNPSTKFKETEVILRSIYDEVYPNANEEGESSSWFKSYLHDTYNDGIQLHLYYWTYEKIIINPHGEWVLKKEFDKKYSGETIELNVNIIGRIPFFNIVDIIEDGDGYFGCPHIYCIFRKDMGPFSEICYEYHNYETEKRFLFEEGQRTLISEYDFENLKNQQIKS